MKSPDHLKNFLITCFVLGAFGISNAQFAGGSGTSEDPFLIQTSAQLDSIRVTGKTSADMKYFKLIADIDLEEFGEWTPYSSSNEVKPNFFFVHLDGNGHVIKNLKCTRRMQYGSLIGILCGSVRNLGVIDAEIDSARTGGILCGYVGRKAPSTEGKDLERGLIENCFVTGKVSGYAVVGGLAGSSGAKGQASDASYIINSYASVDVRVLYEADGSNVKAGGICGENFGTIEKCFSKGTVTSDLNLTNAYLGGISGCRSNYLITKNISYSSIESKSTSIYLGRIFGYSSPAIATGIDCWAFDGSTLTSNGTIMEATNNSYLRNKPMDGITKTAAEININSLQNDLEFNIGSIWANTMFGKYPQLAWVASRPDNNIINGLNDLATNNPKVTTTNKLINIQNGQCVITLTEKSLIRIFNESGQIIHSKEAGIGSTSVNLPQKGIHLINIISDNHNYSTKFIY